MRTNWGRSASVTLSRYSNACDVALSRFSPADLCSARTTPFQNRSILPNLPAGRWTDFQTRPHPDAEGQKPEKIHSRMFATRRARSFRPSIRGQKRSRCFGSRLGKGAAYYCRGIIPVEPPIRAQCNRRYNLGGRIMICLFRRSERRRSIW